MAKRSNAGTRVWLDHYDVSGFINSVEQSISVQTPEVTCLSDIGPRRVEDGYDHSHSHSGFFDGDENALDQRVFEALGAGDDHYLCKLFGASAEGSVAYESMVRLSSQPRSAAAGGAVVLNWEAQGSGGMFRGLVLRNATIVGNGNGDGQDQGAATVAGQEYGAVFRAFSGTFTSFDAKVQHSSDNGGADPWVDVAGLSATISAAGVTRVSTTGVVKRYVRVVIANWVGTSVGFAATGGVVAGTS